MDPRLAQTLDATAEATAVLEERWWIIGSAAAVLAGSAEEVADVDLLTSTDDAARLLSGWRVDPPPPLPSPLFASEIFGRADVAPLPIEVMAGLRVRGVPLIPQTRVAVPWKDGRLYVPDVPEQIAILERFGREKDLRRAERLRTISSAADPSGRRGSASR